MALARESINAMALRARSPEIEVFHLKWNNSKIPNLKEDTRMTLRSAVGVQFAPNEAGQKYVALNNGAVFSSVDDMLRSLKLYGYVNIEWQGDEIGAVDG
jgi:hypothetical protein